MVSSWRKPCSWVDLTLGRKQQRFVIVQLARDQLLAGHQLFGHPLLLASLPLHHQAFLDLATLVLIQELLAKLRLARAVGAL